MDQACYEARVWSKPGGFTAGIEGPACDRDGNLYAVNYEKSGTIGKIAPDGEESVFLELPEGSTGCGIRFDGGGDMLIADYTGHNVLRVRLETRSIRVHAHEPAMNQPNDLAIASSGVLFASDPNWKEGSGQLWRVSPDGRTERLEAGMGTANGIEISPDERTLYVNETVQRKIWAYDLSPDGRIANKRLFIEFPDFGLDGMRCDMAGRLYVTRFGKGCIAKLTPDGTVEREIPLSGKKCTNLTFGGPDGRTCYVTMSDTGRVEVFRVENEGRCWAMWGRGG